MQRVVSLLAAVVSLGLIEGSVLADDPAKAPIAGADSVIAPAGGGQAVLGARVLGGALAYKACAQAACAPSSGDPTVTLPLGATAKDITIDILSIGAGRHALFAHTPSWGALLAAAAGPTPEARVLWSGANGFSKGEAGEQYGELLEVTEPEADKTVRILLGDVREDVTICGRKSILSPKVLDPKDLTFKGARVQRLRRDEREKAASLSATQAADAPLQSLGRVLQAAAASTAIGAPGALTDGDPETTWSEKRGGDGNGEFVQIMRPSKSRSARCRSSRARPPKRFPRERAREKSGSLRATRSLR